TRNMVTGASNADLAVILIDARKGVIEQTRRHSIIASLLGIRHVVVAVNKMDLVDFSERRYNEIITEYKNIEKQLGLSDVMFIPISALGGDNIVDRSEKLSWYKGEPLLHILEHVTLNKDINLTDVRFAVQYVIRPQTDELHDYRGYAGRLSSGVLKKGDKVVVLPAGIPSTIRAIETGGKETDEAFAPQSIVVHLSEDIDVSRGDMIVKQDAQPLVTQDLEVLLCWMDAKPLEPGSKYLLQHNTRQVRCVIKEIDYRLNVNTLEKESGVHAAQLNDVCRVILKTASPLAVDRYKNLRNNGGAILIDETSYVTVGACIIS
ncbi:MAG: sulfate adenylyltransferase subunit 1, partial [Bacteroidia bacterium]